MIGRNLTHQKYMRLFGQGMGLFTVGAACLVVGLQGPVTGTASLAMLALGSPFLLVAAAILLLPLVVSIGNESPLDEQSEPTAEPQSASAQFITDD